MRHSAIIILTVLIFTGVFVSDAAWEEGLKSESSVDLIEASWGALAAGDVDKVMRLTDRCIALYGKRAQQMQRDLSAYSTENINAKWALNDVAAAYFIQGEAYRKAGQMEEAKLAYQTVIDHYTYGQVWDPRGWYWKPAEAARETIALMDRGMDIDFGDRSSVTLVVKAWEALADNELDEVLIYTDKAIQLYSPKAREMQLSLDAYPEGQPQDIHNYWALNDIATAYFIRGEAYQRAGNMEDARTAYQTVVDQYSFGQCWDPRGWFWKPATSSELQLEVMAQKQKARIRTPF